MLPVRSAAIGLLVMGIALGACSSKPAASSTPDSVSSATADQRARIETAIDGYFGATTPEAVCATISAGFEDEIKGVGAIRMTSAGQSEAPASSDCPNVVRHAVKNKQFILKPQTVTVGTILVQGDRAAATVTDSAGPHSYFLVLSTKGWLIHDLGSPPPDWIELNGVLTGPT